MRISSTAQYNAAFTPPSGPFVSKVVHLGWTANGDADLAGYNVYRGTATGGPYARISATLLNGPQYDDSTFGAGRFYYVVTAVDLAGQESITSSEVSGGPTGY